MKNIIYFVFLITVVSSCSKKEPAQSTKIFDGKWNLMNVSCLCEPTDFKIGEHIWDFNMQNKKVSITNSKNASLQMYENGLYPFSISGTKITIDSDVYDFEFKNDKLYISNKPEADGPLMEFVRDN